MLTIFGQNLGEILIIFGKYLNHNISAIFGQYLDHTVQIMSKNKSNAVLAGLVDFSKTFNRIDHNLIVTILGDLNIPTCALKLIISYLTERKMCVRYQGAESAEQHIPEVGHQGGLLTVILLICKLMQLMSLAQFTRSCLQALLAPNLTLCKLDPYQCATKKTKY